MKDMMRVFLSGGLLISLITLIGWWQLFKKAGYPGWYAIIPFYNLYIFCEMVTGSGFLFLFMFIPILNAIMLIYLIYRLARVFGHGLLMTLGLIFLYPLFILVLALGSSSYNPNI
ncbi:MAG: DUF5684 domain-containing protein [Longibaculum sp.]